MRWLSGTRSAAGVTRQDPSMRRWVCTVRPPLVRASRCLPRGTTSVISCPVSVAVASRGTRKSVRVSVRPASASCRRCAVYQTVSPSGMHYRRSPPRGSYGPRLSGYTGRASRP